MNLTTIVSTLVADYTKYAPAIGLIATGVALITAKNYGPGVQAVVQGIALIVAGATAVSLHYSIAKVPAGVLDAASRHD